MAKKPAGPPSKPNKPAKSAPGKPAKNEKPNKPSSAAAKPPTADELDKAWNEQAKDAKAPAGFTNPNVQDGIYIVAISKTAVAAYAQGDKKGTSYAKTTFTLAVGELKGEQLQEKRDLDGTPIEALGGKTNLDMFSVDLQRCGVDTSNISSFKDALLAYTNLSDPAKNGTKPQRKLYVRIKVSNTYQDAADPKNTTGAMRHFQRTTIIGKAEAGQPEVVGSALLTDTEIEDYKLD